MVITYLGHASLLVEIGDYSLIFDPYIAQNPKNIGIIDVNTLKADYVLVSHAHPHHCEDVEAICKNTDATLIANSEIVNYYQKAGITKTCAMNIGGCSHFEFGSVYMTSALHSSTFQDGTYGGAAAGFIIESEDKNFYFAGDTAPFYEMRLYSEKVKLDFGILPIGDVYTMDINQALIASDFLNIKNIIGTHYDTFQEIEIDHIEAEYVATANNKKLILMNIGEKITL
ncbi:MAG: metal-dependent hydrolase [Cytophagales bacterium]|nr:metal-dependent hydrolase [Cytophagales bacterium]